ncbi:hypothetical protein PVAP13_9NG750377 [Panicum virgatum]|uniref:Uncharacterized protein n=1 Tax=Panicum virgatum TaxID=38727 RepID=A0A8T0N3U6_PANVG|nr:hypothetical protein PVAP13_9NG750377 [Panicum virgatum]
MRRRTSRRSRALNVSRSGSPPSTLCCHRFRTPRPPPPPARTAPVPVISAGAGAVPLPLSLGSSLPRAGPCYSPPPPPPRPRTAVTATTATVTTEMREIFVTNSAVAEAWGIISARSHLMSAARARLSSWCLQVDPQRLASWLAMHHLARLPLASNNKGMVCS